MLSKYSILKPIFGRFLTIQVSTIQNHHPQTTNRKNYATEASIELPAASFRLHNLTQGPSTKITLTKDDALSLYNNMQTIRRMEKMCHTLYRRKLVRGFCHLYEGQEAVAVGIHATLRPKDTAITSYRCHAWALLMDTGPNPLVNIISELAGKQKGCSRGKGGSMHMYNDRLYGGNAIVGAQVPLGVGIALAAKYRGVDEICCTIFGDGAANNGQVFEAYNMAMLYQVPCIFICENNRYISLTQGL